MDASGNRRRTIARSCALLLGLALLASSALAAPLKVAGRFLQDAHGNNLMIRGVNVPVFKSGYVDDLDAVAASIAATHTNAVRIEWWAVPPGGTTQYTVANFDRAIQKFYDLGIVPIVELHDLTFQYGHDQPTGPNSDGNDRTIFATTITQFWTRSDVVAVLVKHQDHLVVNLANEWGSSRYSDGTSTATNFIQNYADAVAAMRAAGIVAPLMIDAPKGFEYAFLLDHGAALLAVDPQHNVMLSTHAYWAASDPAFTAANVSAILDALAASGLPIVLGEASDNAYTTIPCDPIDYTNLLTRANANGIGYLFWAWYEDGQCLVGPTSMNITLDADGVSRPTAANPGYGYDALSAPGFGIDAAAPPTTKADFSPVTDPPRLFNISTRGMVLTGNDVMIGGFVVGGSVAKTIVVRARGPSLAPFGIPNPLPNPTLTLVRSADQSIVAANDDWQSDAGAAQVFASGLAPGDPAESALIATLPPGAYTAIVSGVGGGTGVGIVEVFEVDHPETPLANISTRGEVLTGGDVMIGGFVVRGAAPQTVVVRARGPSLAAFGIANALANPMLTLVRSSDQSIVAANDDWQGASNAAQVSASGFAPADPLEAAILVTLPPGAYTAIVSGAGGGTGVGIMEVFATP